MEMHNGHDVCVSLRSRTVDHVTERRFDLIYTDPFKILLHKQEYTVKIKTRLSTLTVRIFIRARYDKDQDLVISLRIMP